MFSDQKEVQKNWTMNEEIVVKHDGLNCRIGSQQVLIVITMFVS